MAIALAFLQIFGMEWIAMLLEKNLDSQCKLWGSGSSRIPHGYCHNLGLSLISSSAEQLKSPLPWMDGEHSCLTSAAEESCPAYEQGVQNSSCSALATWMRWAAMALALTDRCVNLDGCWATPSRHVSAQLFLLECVKFIWLQFFPTMPASCTEWLDEMVSYVWVIRLLILLQ